MSCLGITIEGYELEVLTFFLLAVPAALYVMAITGGRGARVFFGAGLIVHLAGMAVRMAVTGRLPLAEKHDNISFMAFVAAAVFFIVTSKQGRLEERDISDAQLSVIPLVALLMFIAIGHRTIDTISPFMQTPWFYLHSFLYFASYGMLAVSACMGVHLVLTGRGQFEFLQYRLAALAWVVLSLSLFAGSVWFYLAYGTYWLWSAKELWISMTWLFIGLYLHARLMAGLRGRGAAVIGGIGFLVAMFTYFGVGTVIPSPPSQF